MKEHSRYRIVSEIARGEFATVYHGKDIELDRDVAIKQIHSQYLSDPTELERYWREAQLMARLQHPCVMTIYDIVRERGWLILELAQGNLKQRLAGKPIDIEDLRLTLIYMCQALQFLARNGIVHGDIKPTNLLLDRNHRVKLGDFGIARHLAHSEGSVVKGTTKYMAPEVISDQFGAVGPFSDLYSLGFSAYELLCGEHFDSLFPGLNMFGRDAQVAWMMWHTSLDRRLPEISRVLEGVPPDLARVIQRMIEKDPKRRYKNADEVLFDLKASHEGKDSEALKQAEAEKVQDEKRKANKRRILAYIALGASSLLSLPILLIPAGKDKPIVAQSTVPAESMIELVVLDRQELILRPITESTTGQVSESRVAVQVRPGEYRLTLNGRTANLEELKPGDRVSIQESGELLLIDVERATEELFQGTLARVDTANGRLEFEDASGARVSFAIPAQIPILINDRSNAAGRPYDLSDLKTGDEVSVSWVPESNEQVATSVQAAREVKTSGQVARIEAGERAVWVEIANEAEPLKFVLDDNATVSLNGVDTLPNGQVFGLTDLRAGDAIELAHRSRVSTLEVTRRLTSSGILRDFNPDRTQLQVELDEPPKVVAFAFPQGTRVAEVSGDDGQSVPRPARFMRRGDRLEIAHSSIDLIEPQAEEIQVSPATADDRWALVVMASKAHDPQLGETPYAKLDGQRLAASLAQWYRVPEDRLILLDGPTKLEMSDAINSLGARVRENDQVIVYFVGRGYLDDRKEPWLATAELEWSRLKETGYSLRELIRKLESFQVGELLLLLETGHDSGASPTKEPASAQLVESLKRTEAHPVSTTVEVLVGNATGEQAGLLASGGGSVFTEALALGFEGAADGDNDGRVTANELAATLPSLVAQQRSNGAAQSVVRYVPNPTPPRLGPAAGPAVAEVLGLAALSRYDGEAFEAVYRKAVQACLDQPDADLAYGLVNFKHNRTADARRFLEQAMGRFPQEPTSRLALAWQNAVVRRYADTLAHLNVLAEHLPVGPELEEADHLAWCAHAAHMLGVYREFATLPGTEVGWSEDDLMQLDQRVASWPQTLTTAYDQAREQTRKTFEQLQAELTTAEGAARARIESQLTRIGAYGDLNLELWQNYLRLHLDD